MFGAAPLQPELLSLPHNTMYFWNLEELKSEIVERPLSDREVLPYLVTYGLLPLVSACFPASAHNIWDQLGAVWSTVLWALGLIYLYRKNGGAEGRHFLQRYVAILWVVGVRFIVMLAPVAIAFAVLTSGGNHSQQTQWYEFLTFAVLEVVIYWRVGHHLARIFHSRSRR